MKFSAPEQRARNVGPGQHLHVCPNEVAPARRMLALWCRAMPWRLRTLPTVWLETLYPRLASAPPCDRSPTTDSLAPCVRSDPRSSSQPATAQRDCRQADPSNSCANSLRNQPRMVSGFAATATSANDLLSSRWAISAKVRFAPPDSCSRPLIWARRIRFSAQLSPRTFSTFPARVLVRQAAMSWNAQRLCSRAGFYPSTRATCDSPFSGAAPRMNKPVAVDRTVGQHSMVTRPPTAEGHISHDADRLASTRVRRAAVARDCRSAGAASPSRK